MMSRRRRASCSINPAGTKKSAASARSWPNRFDQHPTEDEGTRAAQFAQEKLKAEKARKKRLVLLRQKSISDNQSHHARENQQCREGFSDHWLRRMARSR